MMAAGNPNWWSMNGMHPQPFLYGGAAASNPSPPDINHHAPLRSWSDLLLGGNGIGGVEEEEEVEESIFVQQKKVEKWEEKEEEQILNLNPSLFTRDIDVKQESNNINYANLLLQDHHHQYYTTTTTTINPWPPRQHAVSSPTSCITTTFNFSSTASTQRSNNQNRHSKDHSSECNSKGGSGGVSNKKARVQQSSPQPALKVRKEKLGERITALHQLVSPFGKTDTASVLSEAIGYIRFLQTQIEALSSPYMRNAAAGNTVQHQRQHYVQERHCLFPEEPSQQFLNDIVIEGRGASKQDSESGGSVMKELRSRGLCLVPISCIQNVGNENGADYWAPAAFNGGF